MKKQLIVFMMLLSACGEDPQENNNPPQPNNNKPKIEKTKQVITATGFEDHVYLTWTGDKNATGYELRINGGPWQSVRTPSFKHDAAAPATLSNVIASASTKNHGRILLDVKYDIEDAPVYTYEVRGIYNDGDTMISMPAMASRITPSVMITWSIDKNGQWMPLMGEDRAKDGEAKTFRATVTLGEQVETSEPVLGQNFLVTKLATGYNKTCVVFSDHKLSCFGQGEQNGLGYGEQTNRSTDDLGEPINVGFDVNDVVIGEHHICALGTMGQVACWGANDKGQLDTGDPQAIGDEPNEMPPNLKIASGVDQLCAGQNHTCARSGASIECWGANDQMQLGAIHIPDVTNIACGANHVCVISQGEVKCWGANDKGQLGINSTASSAQLSAVIRATHIFASGDRTCAHNGNLQTVKCWGDSQGLVAPYASSPDLERIMDQPGEAPIAPQIDRTPSGEVTSMDVGIDHQCSVHNASGAHSVKCWGMATSGKLGVDDGQQRGRFGGDSATSIDFTDGAKKWTVRDVQLGANHSCALTASGDVMCWGDNTYGQCGSNAGQTLEATTINFLPLFQRNIP